MADNLNILLELSETNEWVFEIVSNVELKTQIHNKEKRIMNVKPKLGSGYMKECKTCSDLLTVKVFYAHDKTKKDERPDNPLPIESIFVKEEGQVLQAEKKPSLFASPIVTFPVIKPPIAIAPVVKSPMPVQTQKGVKLPPQNKISEPPRIVQPVKPTPKKREHIYRFQCQTCEQTFPRQERLNNHLKKKRCFARMALGNRKKVIETLAYLPIGLYLPDLNNLKHPYTNQIVQADNTITYIHQEKAQRFLWITNFDLFGSDDCDVCEEPFKGIQHKLLHRRQEHFFPGGKKTCNGCEKLCETLKERNTHQLYCPKHDQIVPYFCCDCNVLFNDRTSFKMHLFKEHPETKNVSEQPFSCDICDKKFKRQYHVKNHIQNVHYKDQLPYLRCAHCSYKSKFRKPICNHLVVKHFPQMAKAKCVMCSPPKYFNQMSAYVRHRVVDHRGENPMPESVVQGADGPFNSLNIERPMLFEHPEAKCDQKDEESQQMERDSEDEVTEVEVLQDRPEKVLILDSDGEDDDDDILVRYLVMSDQPELKSSQPDVKITSSQPELETTSSQPEVDIFKANKKTKLDYLPEGLVLPNLNYTNFPVSEQVQQPDGTVTYIFQTSSESTLWITNFDLQAKKCELCDASIELLCAYLRHRVAFHFFPANSVRCIGCNRSFNSHDERRRHTLYCLKKSNIDVSFCYICNIRLDDFWSYREHLMSFHPFKYVSATEKKTAICPICQKQVNLKTNTMAVHIRKHDDPKPFKCAHCSTTFSSKRTLLNHLTKIHFQALVKHICTECSPVKCFNETVTYLQHRRVVHGVLKPPPKPPAPTKKVTCPKCQKVIAESGLKKHLKTVHNPKEDLSMLSCDECGKIFLTVSSLEMHKKSHLPDSERPHKCQFCGKGFNSPAPLKEHERDHTGEKPFVCTFCEKAFAKKQTFKDHVNTHTGEGYKCEHCDRVLWDHSSFRKHLKTHETQLGIKLTYNRNERRWADFGLLDKVKDLL